MYLTLAVAWGWPYRGMVAGSPVRVLVGEDQPLLREGIARVLEVNGFEVVDTTGKPETSCSRLR